jgi:hypothetical protein
MLHTHYHLRDAPGALKLARELGEKDLSFFEARARNPFSVKCDRTVILPFVADGRVPVEFWPGVAGKVNGQALTIMFDTGAAYLVMGKERADSFGVPPNARQQITALSQ